MPVEDALKEIETEVRRSRDWKRGRELAAALSPPLTHAYETVFDWIESKHPVAPATEPLDAPSRRAVCRLALIALDAHTNAPAWSNETLSRMVKALLAIPGIEPADPFKAMWELLLEHTPELTKTLAAFIRALALTYLLEHRSRQTELQWLVDADLAVTPAEAFFKYQTFVLRPELYSEDVQGEVLFQLRNDPVAKPYLGR